MSYSSISSNIELLDNRMNNRAINMFNNQSVSTPTTPSNANPPLSLEMLNQKVQLYEQTILTLMATIQEQKKTTTKKAVNEFEDEILEEGEEDEIGGPGFFETTSEKDSLTQEAEQEHYKVKIGSRLQSAQEKKAREERKRTEKEMLEEQQKKELEEEDRLIRCNPHSRQKIMTKIGMKKVGKTLDQLIILSFLGGAFIGIGSIAALKTGGNMPGLEKENPGLTKLFFSGIFSVGLTLVLLTGSELYTGNTMTLMAALLRGKINPYDLVRNWTTSLVCNLLGALAVAYFFMYLPTPAHDIEETTRAAYVEYAIHFGEKKAFRSFWGNFVLGIACNWLVGLAVYTTYGTKKITDKVVGLFLPILAFVSSGFEHSIANGFFIPLAMMYGSPITVYDFLIGNMLPVTIGNTIGGSVLIGVLFWWAHGWRTEHKHHLDNLFIDKLKKTLSAPILSLYDKVKGKILGTPYLKQSESREEI